MSSARQRSAFFVRLCHHRWSAEVAAAVAQAGGCRLVELQHRLDAFPDSLRPALAALLDLGLVRRNPGYGHPLRPEYLPTAAGARAGPGLDRLLRLLADVGGREVAQHKWSLPLLDALSDGRHRFGELQSRLPGITPRALAISIKELVEAGLIRRDIMDGYPPVPIYSATPAGRRVARALQRLWIVIQPGAAPDMPEETGKTVR